MKMHDIVIITFESTTQALSFEDRCHHYGINGRLIPLPSQICAGCGLSWKINICDFVKHEKIIKKLNYKDIFILE